MVYEIAIIDGIPSLLKDGKNVGDVLHWCGGREENGMAIYAGRRDQRFALDIGNSDLASIEETLYGIATMQ